MAHYSSTARKLWARQEWNLGQTIGPDKSETKFDYGQIELEFRSVWPSIFIQALWWSKCENVIYRLSFLSTQWPLQKRNGPNTYHQYSSGNRGHTSFFLYGPVFPKVEIHFQLIVLMIFWTNLDRAAIPHHPLELPMNSPVLGVAGFGKRLEGVRGELNILQSTPQKLEHHGNLHVNYAHVLLCMSKLEKKIWTEVNRIPRQVGSF